jgi:uncharacterized membrane protein
MKRELIAILFVAALAGGFQQGAAAQTFHSDPVEIPGSTNVLVTGINDSGAIVLNYVDSAGTGHCMLIAGGTRTAIADPNELGTGPGKGTSCYGINNAGVVVGTYSFASFGNGFLYTAGSYTDVIVPTATAGTSAYGLNNIGQVVGSYADNTGQYGFLYTVSSGAVEKLQVPNASGTLAVGINDNDIITFQWVDSLFVYHGAILRNGNYTIINVPGASQTTANGINKYGQILLTGQDSSGAWQGYLLANGHLIACDVVNAANTFPFGINDKGEIVGGYNPSATPTSQVGFFGYF